MVQISLKRKTCTRPTHKQLRTWLACQSLFLFFSVKSSLSMKPIIRGKKSAGSFPPWYQTLKNYQNSSKAFLVIAYEKADRLTDSCTSYVSI